MSRSSSNCASRDMMSPESQNHIKVSHSECEVTVGTQTGRDIEPPSGPKTERTYTRYPSSHSSILCSCDPSFRGITVMSAQSQIDFIRCEKSSKLNEKELPELSPPPAQEKASHARKPSP